MPEWLQRRGPTMLTFGLLSPCSCFFLPPHPSPPAAFSPLPLAMPAKVLQNFLVASSSQMTTQGLRQVISCLLDFCSWPPWVRAAHAFQFSTTTRQVQPTRLPESPHATLHLPVGVLFWNNHFLTVVRFNKTLYSLLSDEGYANEVTVCVGSPLYQGEGGGR